MGLENPDPKGLNLNESLVLDTVVLAARLLNEMESDGKSEKNGDSRSS